MHIAVASDNNYIRHMGVTVCSLLDNNRDVNEIVIHVLDNGISEENKKNMKNIIEKYNRKIKFYNLKDSKKYLGEGSFSANSLAMYSRIFLPELLDESIEKIIYIDVDAVVSNSLKELWEENIEDNLVAGVLDVIPDKFKVSIGLDIHDMYINSGFIVINIRKWREEFIKDKILDFISKNNGRETHYDQGAINAICKGRVKVLHPKYNITTIFYTMKYEKVLNLYGVNEYYPIEEIEYAKKNPVFIHYVAGYTTRPWVEGCKHPKAYEYMKYLEKTPWVNTELEKDMRGIKERLIALYIGLVPASTSKKLWEIREKMKKT